MRFRSDTTETRLRVNRSENSVNCRVAIVMTNQSDVSFLCSLRYKVNREKERSEFYGARDDDDATQGKLLSVTCRNFY